ncbi:NAD(+)--rifampin ADP-ribosyltransferase [Microcoleus sp. AR_TQ3_B6]|uniref:NAD(+)--rifampin ADP-ribosyltransferase n=1 Tax=Microcoleus sp. AR_TQ3_B6 TaxID=3055284 RepID=UPI002FD2AAF6
MIPQQFYHGTRADLKPGDLIVPGYNSNYRKFWGQSLAHKRATLSNGNTKDRKQYIM